MSLSLSHLDGNTRSTLNIPYPLHIDCNINQSFTCKNVNAKHLCQCEQVYNTISGEGGRGGVECTSYCRNTGRHFVPLEDKILFLALVIVRIILNMIVRQMSLNVC